MSEITEGGLDRRSLIKKGLVAGGVVAVAPAISTFNSPAFASSHLDVRLAFNVNAVSALGIVVPLLSSINPTAPPDNTGCAGFEAQWDAATGGSADVSGSFVVNPPLGPSQVVFTAGSGCEIVAAVEAGTCVGPDVATPTQVRFNLAFVEVTINTTYYLLVNC